jgi:hypothetical protein
MSFCIQSETSTKLFPDFHIVLSSANLQHTILKLNNKILKYNRNPKLLGVTLDEKLNFGQHILNIEKAGDEENK